MPNRRPIEWTPQMIKLVQDHYPTMFNKALALWVGVSIRSLERKAKELGVEKVKDFNTYKADGISRIISDGVKKAYAEGRKTTQFQKGVRNNPNGEFKSGHRFEGEIEEKRLGRIRATHRRKKMLKLYGLK